jgi:hypothetical protein
VVARAGMLTVVVVALTLGGGAADGLGKGPAVIGQGFFIRQHYADFKGVIAGQSNASGRGRVGISVHGLEPGATYEVAAVTKPCSSELDEAGVEAATVFEAEVTASEGGDAFVTRPIALNRGVRRARSMRLYQTTPAEGFVQRDCVKAVIGTIAGGGKGAAIGAARRFVPRLVEGWMIGSFRGVVGAALGTGGRARAFASLHGLQPGGDYEVVGSDKPCGTELASNVEPVLALTVTAGAGGDAFVTRPIAMKGRFRSMRSLRVYEKEQDAEVACKAAVFIGGGAATGALIG